MEIMDETPAQLVAELAAAREQIAELEALVTAHEELTRKFARLATFPEQNPNLVIEMDLAGRVTYLNPVAQARFPALWSEGAEHPLLEGIQATIAIFETGEREHVTREMCVDDAVYEQKICSVENHLIRIFAHDVTRRKRAEEEAQELAEQLRQLSRRVVLAQEQERQRVARELHDEAGQALTALKISLELIQAELPADAGVLRQNLGEAVALTDTTRKQIRLLAQGLRPPTLDSIGLRLTLEGFCRDFSRRTQLDIHFESTELPTLSDLAKICLYRFVQEALTNVAKHARANCVRVTLACDDHTISLSVADNGRGFEPPAFGQSGGLGLLGMQERLELLGGSLEIESEPGQGCRVVGRIPVEGAP